MKNASEASTRYSVHVWLGGSSIQPEWRGKVHELASGEVEYFRDWNRLIEFLQDTHRLALRERRADEHQELQTEVDEEYTRI